MNKKFKYQSEIDELVEDKVSMPKLFDIDTIKSYRYVFRYEPQKNNIPAYISKPKRKLKNPKVIGYALSCYEDLLKAEEQYINFKRTSKNFQKIAGDALSVCDLDNEDGKVTKSTDTTHFSLFEYSECDLNSKLQIIKDL